MPNNETARRVSHTVELIKSVLLGLLVFSMISLVVVYIGGTSVYETVSAKNNPTKRFDKLWSIEGGAAAVGLDEGRLLPEFIGYRQAGGTPTCSVGSGDAAAELYELITPCLLELFGNSSVCRPLAQNDGADRIADAVAGDEFIYLRYHVPVLYQLIYAYASDKLTIAESEVAPGESGSISAYISELVIVPDKEYTAAAHRYIAYASDGEGGYFEFRPAEHVVTSSFYLSKLAESGANIDTRPFRFAEDERLPVTQPIIDAPISYAIIEAAPADPTARTVLTPLLRLFGYNPDKLSSYVDDTGARVFVDSSSRLRISGDTVSFLTSDAASGTARGIGIDSMLGYSSEDTLNLFDKLTAVDNLIRSLGEISPSLIGGEASLCLGSVYSSDTLLVIEYFLTYDNIRVAGDTVLRAVLTQDTICQVELRPVNITAGGETAYCLDQNYTLRKLTDLGRLPAGKKAGGMRLVYDGADAAWSVVVD